MKVKVDISRSSFRTWQGVEIEGDTFDEIEAKVHELAGDHDFSQHTEQDYYVTYEVTETKYTPMEKLSEYLKNYDYAVLEFVEVENYGGKIKYEDGIIKIGDYEITSDDFDDFKVEDDRLKLMRDEGVTLSMELFWKPEGLRKV